MLFLKRLKPLSESMNIIQHQFGFCEKYSNSILYQIPKISNVIKKSLYEGKVCSSVFLDMAQAFNKVLQNIFYVADFLKL